MIDVTGAAIAERFVADRVLDDCKHALERLELCTEDNSQQRRVFYVAVISLLRAVGHVLHKVDGQMSGIHAEAVEELYRDVRSNAESYPIFHEFIEKERNNVLKEYIFSADKVIIPRLVAFRDASLLKDEGFEYDMLPMDHGYYEGHDFRDLATEAIEFWEAALKRVKTSVAAKERM